MCEGRSWLKDEIEMIYEMDNWAREAMRAVEIYGLAGGGEGAGSSGLPPHQMNQLLEAAFLGKEAVGEFLERQTKRPKLRGAWTVKPPDQEEDLKKFLKKKSAEIYEKFGDRGVRLFFRCLASYYHARRQEGGLPNGYCFLHEIAARRER